MSAQPAAQPMTYVNLSQPTVTPPPPAPAFAAHNPPPTPNTNRRTLYDLAQVASWDTDKILQVEAEILAFQQSWRPSPINGVQTFGGPGQVNEISEANLQAELLKYAERCLTPVQIEAAKAAGILKPPPAVLPPATTLARVPGTSTVAPIPVTSTPIPPTSGSKRPAPVDDDTDSGDGEDTFDCSCDVIRRKIRNFLDSGEMKVTEFIRTLGVNSNSYGRFMKLKGAWSGIDNGTMSSAYKFFKQREKAGKPIAKKAKAVPKGAKSGYLEQINDAKLDGENEDDVKVYETCDEVRKKINAHMKKEDVTQAQFLRDLAAMFNATECKLQSKQLNDFRGKSGPDGGNTSRVFYAAYVFFEKLRLAEGKPKSKHRKDMEAAWPNGFDTEHNSGGRYWTVKGETPVMGKLGKVSYR